MPGIPEDTIAAIATPVGEGGIAVLRVSGPESVSLAEKIFQPKKSKVSDFPSHTVHFGIIQNEKGEILDQVLLTLFRAPDSYTAEDVIEISCHGGLILAKRILDLLIQNGARHAEPGEFTKRAFLNGKIDLTQAEAVLDLIKAKSEKSLETAVRQLSGSLSRKLKSLKEDLMEILAHMEAFLDFPDEHLEVYGQKEFSEKFASIQKEMQQLLASFKRGSLLREGITIALVGKPNVGKSSLFNALLSRDRALVSEFPGTTRDALEEAIEIQGIYLRLVDTAGLRSGAGHPMDQMGMEKTRQVLKEAQLYLFLVDGSDALDQTDRQAFEEIKKNAADLKKSVLVLINKCDLKLKVGDEAVGQLTGIQEPLKVSSRTREGFDQLEQRIVEKIFEGKLEMEGEQITRLRHKNAIENSLEALRRCEKSFHARESLEFVVLDLRQAVDALRELIGEIYSEDLLDVIFAEFCIGK